MDIDEFSDDGLDDMGVTELDALEAHAIQLTQAKQLTQPQRSQLQDIDYGWEEDDDLDTTEVTNDAGLPVGRHNIHHTPSQQDAMPPPRMIPPVPNPQWNPTFHSANRPSSQMPPPALSRPPQSQLARALLPGASQAGDVVSALQQRLRALESELNAARGEASILRAKSVKTERERDMEVMRLRKINAEQQERHERMLETAVAAEKSANTELQFMQRDLKEKAISDRTKKKDSTFGGNATTPKKAGGRTWGIADGFDEMDIAISPSKGQGRGKAGGSVATAVGERTPSKGKRKRPTIDSPVTALETHTDDVFMADARGGSSQPTQQATVTEAPAAPFEFLQLILDHGTVASNPPTFDALSKLNFPSEPTTSLAAKIFERIPLMGNAQQPMQLLVDFVEFVTTLWSRCFEEQYWAPVRHLVQLIAFTFQLHTTSVAPLVIRNLLPTIESTVFIIAEAHQHRLADGSLPSNMEPREIENYVDTQEIMSLLHICALACATNSPESERDEYSTLAIWQLLSWEFVLLLLTNKQDFADTISMLDLLATSSLPNSIGPICHDREPDFVARLIIDRVSLKLVESLRSNLSTLQRRQIRAAALRTLISFTKHPFGARQLASHDNALPRLAVCLSASIDDLYHQPISRSVLSQSGAYTPSIAKLVASSQSGADLSHIIAQCVTLIHTLVTSPVTADVADIMKKLSVTHGGNQRYILALGRLNFADDDLIIESGIDVDIIEAAHELLELAATPDEGEIIGDAFAP
ncbi:hypothetical protein VHEMI00255 [[Torrubiella] hemipterigena]|uniref:DNA repair protein Rad26 n=1 Tax=[Torrubiella] hemipterigena TaxID=1531966 RepID=A0A0A1T1Q8_9HYPO|nr:hypothetical protein VHEMI00255 [[Torrubiella] hemipterigena]